MTFKSYNFWGTQRNLFNIGYDLTEWALPLNVSWSSGLITFHFLCFELVYWRKTIREMTGVAP